MPVKYIPYEPNTVEGQATLNNITRTQRVLRYRENDKVYDRIKRGMPYYEVETTEIIDNRELIIDNENPSFDNLIIRGECISACAYLKEQNIKVDLVYIDPPFASGADYAKKVYIRRNPKLAEKIKNTEQEMEMEELKAFEEKMYGDIWKKEDYLNWMYENLLAIKSIMSDTASIYVHLDWHIGHYVKILLDEIFGEDNFRNEIQVKRVKKSIREREFVRTLNVAVDTIFFYAMNEDVTIFPPTKPARKEERWHSFDAPEIRTGMDYELFGCKPPAGRHWMRSENIAAQWIKEKKLRPNPRTGKPEYRIEASDEMLCDTLWDDIPAYAFRNGYITEKSEDLLSRIIETNPNKDVIVADFFGGSGVTAKVANDLGRKFIHVDVGINSIQTTRDRLIEAKANFKILEIKDGVNLFRNPQQTMDKLAKLIPGLQQNIEGISKFWFGAIQESRKGTVPVYVPNLIDSKEKVLDIPAINKIINQELQNLEIDVEKVIVYYIDIEDYDEITKFIKTNNETGIKVELKDLKNLLHDVVVEDIVEYKIKEQKNSFVVEITKFISDRLIQKISEFNEKGNLQALTKGKQFTPIEISKEGLELIELISLDCKNKKGKWNSTTEIKIDKLGYVTKDGEKTKEFWDGKIKANNKPLRLKVRNISGDETIIEI